MNNKFFKNERQNILQGTGKVSQGESIQAIASYLRESHCTGQTSKGIESIKQQEEKRLIDYIDKKNLWNCNINFDLFFAEGAEQRVFISSNEKVLKLNDSIYYLTWLDYLYNLLLNNWFFPETAYELKGFYKSEKNIIYAFS